MAPFRLLVCGGRDYGYISAERQHIHNQLLLTFNLNASGGKMILIHGAATGVDTTAAAWAKVRGLEVWAFPADWSNTDRPGAVVRRTRSGHLYDAAAGGARNYQMLREGRPDMVLAFPGGKGTADMVRRARLAGVKVVKVKRDL